MRRLPTLCVGLLMAAILGSGCGEGGAASGATVSVYVAAPLCREAQGRLGNADGKAGDLEVRAVCLPPVEPGGKADLAASGSNARRATEDSTAVAYLEASDPAARFSRSIVESADIAWIEAGSGRIAMGRILDALAGRGSSSPREAVLEQVG